MIAFDRALPGKPFTLSNPQTVPVTGTLRVHPRLTGPSSTKVIAFALAAGEQKTFANLLQDLAETKASVIRVESSDLLGDTLRPVTSGYSDNGSLVYTPGGTDPTILIAALNSTFRVKIFASNSMIAAFSQEFTVNGEATLALQASAILGDTRIPGASSSWSRSPERRPSPPRTSRAAGARSDTAVSRRSTSPSRRPAAPAPPAPPRPSRSPARE